MYYCSQSLVTVGIFSILMSLSAACFFSDCPNDFTWSKRDVFSKSLAWTNEGRESLQRAIREKIISCATGMPDDVFNARCDFTNAKICCGADKYGSVVCESVDSTGTKERVSSQFEHSFRNYVVVMPHGNLPEKHCVDVGRCCAKGRCKLELRCAYPSEPSQSQLEHSAFLARLLNSVKYN